MDVRRGADAVSHDVIRRAGQGDRSAQKQVLEAYAEFVRRMLYRLLGGSNELEDLQQIVLMRIVTSLPTARFEGPLSTWIGGICVHVARDHLRRRRVRSVVSLVDGGSEIMAMQPGANDVHGVVEAREELARCQSALDELTPEQKTAFVLRTAEGYSVDEIASMMGAARSTTRMRLYYARKHFCRAMAEGMAADATPLPLGTDP